MAKRPMKTPNAPGAAMKVSPLAPLLGQVKGTGMQVDDVSATAIGKGSLRPARAGSASGLGDARALGTKRPQGRTSTNASAQFRITATRTPASEPTYTGTLAAGRILPSIMGSKQLTNFRTQQRYGPQG